MKNISFLLLFAGLVSCMCVHAQTITHNYDASGNFTSMSYKSQEAPSTLKSSSIEDDANGVSPKESKVDDMDTMLLVDENCIKIFPNPNKGLFQIELNGFGENLKKGMLTIYSAQGRVVLILNSLNQLNQVNLNNQMTGTYVLHFNINGKLYNHKVIVEK